MSNKKVIVKIFTPFEKCPQRPQTLNIFNLDFQRSKFNAQSYQLSIKKDIKRWKMLFENGGTIFKCDINKILTLL